ncbi:hypothetical protein KVV02_007990 [Mortierella alpina]|uniref:Uncharacterized protein n=1 Tax=Mortierella alpina TaxID=64518 RepID=A0A9P7ZXF6_MORAP|nr:hypothetical protein KVV02_007990 [Mortierella alpina]
MVDHPDHSPHPSSQRHHTHQHQHQHQHHRQQLSSSHQHQQAQQFKPHHHSSQTQRVYQNYSQEIQGPLSAGVIEGHRAFPSFHSSLHHHPRQPSASSSPSSTSYPNLSVADILDRYQDAHKDFLVSILNAKAKEDERKAEEERYKTEQIKLRSKQLDLELALEKRRGSPPAGRPYAINESESNTTSKRAHYSSTTPASVSAASYNNTSYQSYPPPSGSAQDGSRPQYGRHSHHDLMSNVQDNQEQPSPRDHASVKHGVTHPSYKEQAQAQMQPSPQGRPPSLKINTAVRQSYPKQQAGPNANKTPSSRHYALPGLSNSAQSSPVTSMDYQSYIPPPLTPKDDHVSPTSALSPAPGQTLKRKSIHHDAVMDAVRAKVLRNAGQSQQQREQQQQQHQHLHKKTSADFNARRKTYSQNSPERLKRAMEGFPTPRTAASPNSATTAVAPKLRNGSTTTTTTGTTNTTSPSTRAVDLKQEGPRPLSHSPISPSSSPLANGERGHSGSVRSGSMSPLPSLSGEEGPVSANGEPVAAEGHSKSPICQQTSNDCAADEAEEKSSRYQLDRSRPERATDIGVLVN